MNITFALIFYVLWDCAYGARLIVSGKNLTYNGKNVFLSGTNFAWYSYGRDFGNGFYANSKSVFSQWLTEVANNGGNTIRVWLHVEGGYTPQYDSNGYVTLPDQQGTLINDIRSFLDTAKSLNILVVFVLWNGAQLSYQNSVNLFWDKSKLQSYIDKALTPMVSALKQHPALAAWEIINEPEGLVYNGLNDANNCFNTLPLTNSGAGWTSKYIPMQQILLFINWQAAAIKQADPGALVTVGAWSEHSITDTKSDSRNYYSNACLTAAGGKPLGILDFYQVHTYYSSYASYAPFQVVASNFTLNKPLVIGEFSSACSGGKTVQQLYNYAYNNGYQGAWAWQYAGGSCADSKGTIDQGMAQLKGKSTSSGTINFLLI